ncbi:MULTISPECIES: BRO family protein [unclassified Serratia (in: enterobacteria)]|uniref:BRO-N domain-containing protein n=1 Tax=unclassified Serratia (in: enterobacteria) TaxID=2647522 RepID=UPI000AF6EF0F|nr:MULTISPECIES: BRO family protein [unclassified Serratia (in: enterobacteria)]
MTAQLAFRDTKFNVVTHNNQIWLTSKELAHALKYATANAVTALYNKNSDEFTDGMSRVVESTTSGNYRKKVRIFSLRGAHLIAMFARTEIAKEFRKWVLDILDREVAIGNTAPVFDFEMYAHNAKVAEDHFRFIWQIWREELDPALRKMGSPIPARLIDHLSAIGAITFGLSRGLDKAVEKNSSTH